MHGYKIKLKTILYTAVSIDIDAYYWDTQGVATFFHGVKCPGYRNLNKCQIPSHPGLNSCQMPGGCPGGMGILGFDSYINRKTLISTVKRQEIVLYVVKLQVYLVKLRSLNFYYYYYYY